MRILMVNYEYPPVGGGAGIVTRNTAEQLSQMGNSVNILASMGDSMYKTISDGNLTLYNIPAKRRSVHETGALAMAQFLLRSAFHQSVLLKRNKYDIIHYFFSVPTGLLSFLLPRTVPYIVSLQGGDVPGFNEGEFERMHSLLKPLNRKVLCMADHVTALSLEMKHIVESIFPSISCRIVHNGVDTRLFQAQKRKPFDHTIRILCVARLTEWKGVQYLLQAMEELKHLPVKLSIVGTGHYETELRNLSETLGISDRVSFEGSHPMEKMPDFYNDADIFVLPSFGDSFGLVFVEAMACGLPVIAAKSGFIQEIIRDGENGFLVPPKNATSLARRIEFLGVHPDLRKKMGEKNIEIARRHFSWRAIGKRYRDLYQEAMEKRGNTPVTSI